MFKTKKVFALLVVTLSLIITIFAMVPINKNYKVDPWMSKVNDSKLITEMSIPGTHDSGATHSFFDVAGKCQDLSIKTQLKIGVRFFDIRLQQVNNKLNVVHSFVDQKTKFENVLEDMAEFVTKYPSEFLIVSIKEDAESKNSIRQFDDLLKDTINVHKGIVSTSRSLPRTLKDAKGKIYFMSRYADSTFGIKAYDGWQDDAAFTLNTLYIQDNYKIDTVEEKIADIEATMEYLKTSKNRLVLNFTSCYLSTGFPPTYAVPPAKQINPWLMNKLNETKESKDTLGVIVADFITKELAESIYMRNY